MAKSAQRDRDLPPHEDEDDIQTEPGMKQHDGGGIEIDLSKLPEEDKDDRKGKKGGEDREEEQPGALDTAAEDEDEDLRKRRREERRQRKEDRERRENELKTRLESSERQIAELKASQERGQIEGVKERIGSIEAEMQTLQRQYNEAKALKQEAYTKNDGKAIVEADEAMTAARERYQDLGGQRENIIRNVQAERARPKVSETLANSAKSFMADHKWYDLKGGDRDSAKVMSLDRKMAAEGWDPNTAGYWEELRERVKEEIPHRFDEDEEDRGDDRGERGRERQRDARDERDDERPRRRQTTGGSGREGGERGSANSFYLSAARVAALKEAGMWDDPAKRAKMIKTYKARDEVERKRRQQGGR